MDIELFAKTFSFLTQEETERLASRCNARDVEQGEELFAVGEPSDAVYFVVRGKCAIRKETGFENKMQVVALLSSGSIISENVSPERKHTTSVVAAENSTFWMLPILELERMKTSDARLAMKLIEKFLEVSGKRLDACTERLARIL